MLPQMLLLFAVLCPQVFASSKCVSAIGKLKCVDNPLGQANVQIDLFDRDSYGLANYVDPDDHMSFTYTDDEGRFTIEGCGSDISWFWNVPDPYIQIRHECHGDRETRKLPVFYKFHPESIDFGTINL